MTPIIRFATARDAETILRFIRAPAEFEREPEAVQATPALLRAQMEDRNPPFECLIAEREGEALGFALFFRTYSTWSGCPGLYLEDLFVLEQYRGCGIGRRSSSGSRRSRPNADGPEWNGRCSTGTPARKISTARKARARWRTGPCGV
jgi:GNAT superfamily N-acetyltransferase